MYNYASKILATGSYLPSKILTNDELSIMMDTTDEWIYTRTGIKERRIAENETTSEMAAKAARMALERANLQPNEVDLIIVATTTPDLTFPSTAALVQQHLGITNESACFDVQAVCAGLVYGLAIADNFMRLGQATNILLIGAERMSKILDWQDRSTSVLFGDGAGAILLQRCSIHSPNKILLTQLNGNGNYQDILHTDGGVGSSGTCGLVRMKGPAVFKFAVEKMSNNISELVTLANLKMDDIDVLVPHQANVRIIDAVAKRLNFDEKKIVKTTQNHANTSAASIALALDEYLTNRSNTHQLIAICGIGAGMVWGGAIIQH